MDRRLLEYSPMLETTEWTGPVGERAWSTPPHARSGLDEDAEMTLGAELLAINSEAQLERFLGALVERAAPDGARLARAPVGRALVDLLKRAAQPILPARQLGGSAAGAARPLAVQQAPALISRAAQIFGLELEGLSPEDKEFALAQQFIRFAGAAARNAGLGKGSAPVVAQRAVRSAALRHAPGLLAHIGARPAMQGRWVMQGDQIHVLGC